MPFNFLHPFGFICRFPPVGLSTTSCLYVVSISEFLLHPSASQQLPACIWFQYLGFPCRSTTSRAHLVSISNFSSMCLSSNFLNFLHSLGFNIYALQGVQRPSPCDTLGFPPPSLFCPLLNSYFSHLLRPFSYGRAQLGVNLCGSAPLGGIHLVSISKLSPRASQQFPAFIHLVSRLHLWPLNNFLHASQLGFNV